MNPVIPYIQSKSLGLSTLASSLRIFLSLLFELVSLVPGVSISVMSPVFAGLQTPVTDLKDCLCSKDTA